MPDMETRKQRAEKAKEIAELGNDLFDLLDAVAKEKNVDQIMQLTISSEMVRRKLRTLLKSMDNIDKF